MEMAFQTIKSQFWQTGSHLNHSRIRFLRFKYIQHAFYKSKISGKCTKLYSSIEQKPITIKMEKV